MKLNRAVLMAGLAFAMIAGAGALQAQEQQPRRNRGQGQGGPGGGGFDPAQMEQRMLEGVRDRLEVKEDKDWSALEPLVKKVMTARREQMAGGMRGMFRGGNRGGGGGNTDGNNNGGGNRGGGFRGFGGEPSAEEEALSKAIENNESKDQLKTKMTAFRKAKEAKEKQLKTAQDDLKKVLTVKQEAVALEMGLVQ